MEKLEDYIVRLEKVVTRFESLPGVPHGGAVSNALAAPTQASGSSDATSAPSSVTEFISISDNEVTKVLQVANVIGSEGSILPPEYKDEIVAVSTLFKNGFEETKTIIAAMEKCKKPHPEEMQKLVAPLVAILADANGRTEGKRKDSFHHQKTISEFLQALVFVANTAEAGKPAFHIDQSWQSAEFYANKIRKEFRTKDPKHIEWIDALQNVYKSLRSYVAKYHPKEPVWKSDGISVSEFLGTDPPTTPPPEAPPKKDIPPPQPLKAATHWQPDKSKETPTGEAFTSLKKGFNKVAAGSSMPVPDTVKPEFIGAKLKHVAPVAKEGRIELEMERKWNVEFFKGNKDIVVSETNPRQSVYVFQCQDCVIKVNGKVNAITLDTCKKTALVFEDVVSLVELINCSRTDIQCTNRVSTIVADKSDECKIYIPETSIEVELTTAKSSSINLTVVKSNSEEDPEEHPVPYQFMSKFKDGKLITEPVQHTGAA